MKYLPIPVLVFGLLLHSCSNENQNVIQTNYLLEEYNLYGNVKSYKTTPYFLVNNFGKISKGDRRSGYYEAFNKQGNIIESIRTNRDGSLWWKKTYIYNHGFLIEENEYDENNKLEKKWIHQYDDQGNKIGSNEYNSDGTPESKKSFKYSGRRFLLEENEYNALDFLIEKYTYIYDEHGNEIESICINSEYDYSENVCKKYDKNGNKIESMLYLSDKYRQKDTYQYNEQGKMIEHKKLLSGGNIWTFKYDSLGNEIETTIIEDAENADYSVYGSNRKWTYIYEFDTNNNWIKYTEYELTIPQNVYERTIEYYR